MVRHFFCYKVTMTIVIVNSIGSIFDIIMIGVRYNMSLRELAENKMIFDDELEQVLSKA